MKTVPSETPATARLQLHEGETVTAMCTSATTCCTSARQCRKLFPRSLKTLSAPLPDIPVPFWEGGQDYNFSVALDA